MLPHSAADDSGIAALRRYLMSHVPMQVNLAYESFDPACRSCFTAAEAWTHLVLPIRMEEGCLVCATTRQTMPEAKILLQRKAVSAFRFVFAEPRPLEQFIAEAYAFEGIEASEDAA